MCESRKGEFDSTSELVTDSRSWEIDWINSNPWKWKQTTLRFALRRITAIWGVIAR